MNSLNNNSHYQQNDLQRLYNQPYSRSIINTQQYSILVQDSKQAAVKQMWLFYRLLNEISSSSQLQNNIKPTAQQQKKANFEEVNQSLAECSENLSYDEIMPLCTQSLIQNSSTSQHHTNPCSRLGFSICNSTFHVDNEQDKELICEIRKQEVFDYRPQNILDQSSAYHQIERESKNRRDSSPNRLCEGLSPPKKDFQKLFNSTQQNDFQNSIKFNENGINSMNDLLDSQNLDENFQNKLMSSQNIRKINAKNLLHDTVSFAGSYQNSKVFEDQTNQQSKGSTGKLSKFINTTSTQNLEVLDEHSNILESNKIRIVKVQSPKNNEQVQIKRGLIAFKNDSIEGFSESAYHSKESNMKSYFQNDSQESQRVAIMPDQKQRNLQKSRQQTSKAIKSRERNNDEKNQYSSSQVKQDHQLSMKISKSQNNLMGVNYDANKRNRQTGNFIVNKLLKQSKEIKSPRVNQKQCQDNEKNQDQTLEILEKLFSNYSDSRVGNQKLMKIKNLYYLLKDCNYLSQDYGNYTSQKNLVDILIAKIVMTPVINKATLSFEQFLDLIVRLSQQDKLVLQENSNQSEKLHKFIHKYLLPLQNQFEVESDQILSSRYQSEEQQNIEKQDNELKTQRITSQVADKFLEQLTIDQKSLKILNSEISNTFNDIYKAYFQHEISRGAHQKYGNQINEKSKKQLFQFLRDFDISPKQLHLNNPPKYQIEKCLFYYQLKFCFCLALLH